LGAGGGGTLALKEESWPFVIGGGRGVIDIKKRGGYIKKINLKRTKRNKEKVQKCSKTKVVAWERCHQKVLF